MSIYDLKGVSSLLCDLFLNSGINMNTFRSTALNCYAKVRLQTLLKKEKAVILEQLQCVPGDSADLAKLLTQRGNGGSFEFPLLKPPENSAEVRRGGEAVDDGM